MSDWLHPTAFSSWSDEEADAIGRVVESGQYTMAGEVLAFEAELAAYHRVKHAIAVNSGASANLVAVGAMFHLDKNPLKRGDRVLVPALAWSTTYAPLVQHGLTLKLMDCGNDWNASPNGLYGFSDVALIVDVPVLGNPSHAAAFERRAAENGILMLQDACESIGARAPGGRLMGTFGLMGTVSFFWSHQLSAIEGGAILTDSDQCAELCHMLRNHGWSKGTSRQPPGFAGEYDFQVMGWNVRPLELHCAIARAQLKKLETFKRHRAVNWIDFYNRTKHLPVWFQEMGEGEANPFGIAFTVRDVVMRSRLAVALRENGTDCRPPVGGSFSKHPYSGDASWTGSTPNADRIHETGIFLGLAPWPMGAIIEKTAQIMEEVLT